MNKSLTELLFEEENKEISKSIEIKPDEKENEEEDNEQKEALEKVYPISFTSAKNNFNIVLSRIISKLLKNPNIVDSFEKAVKEKLPDADISDLNKNEETILADIIKRFNNRNPNTSISRLNMIDKKEFNGIDIKIINTSQKEQERDMSAKDVSQISQTNIIPFSVMVDDKIVSFVKKSGNDIKIYNLVFFAPVIGNIVDFTKDDNKTLFLKRIFGETAEGKEEAPIRQLSSITKIPFVAVDSESYQEFQQTIQNAFKYKKSNLITRLLNKINNRKGNINSLDSLNKLIEETFEEGEEEAKNETFVYQKGLKELLKEAPSASLIKTRPIDIFGPSSDADISQDEDSSGGTPNYKKLSQSDKDELNLFFKSLVMQSPGAATKILEKTKSIESQKFQKPIGGVLSSGGVKGGLVGTLIGASAVGTAVITGGLPAVIAAVFLGGPIVGGATGIGALAGFSKQRKTEEEEERKFYMSKKSQIDDLAFNSAFSSEIKVFFNKVMAFIKQNVKHDNDTFSLIGDLEKIGVNGDDNSKRKLVGSYFSNILSSVSSQPDTMSSNKNVYESILHNFTIGFFDFIKMTYTENALNDDHKKILTMIDSEFKDVKIDFKKQSKLTREQFDTIIDGLKKIVSGSPEANNMINFIVKIYESGEQGRDAIMKLVEQTKKDAAAVNKTFGGYINKDGSIILGGIQVPLAKLFSTTDGLNKAVKNVQTMHELDQAYITVEVYNHIKRNFTALFDHILKDSKTEVVQFIYDCLDVQNTPTTSEIVNAIDNAFKFVKIHVSDDLLKTDNKTGQNLIKLQKVTVNNKLVDNNSFKLIQDPGKQRLKAFKSNTLTPKLFYALLLKKCAQFSLRFIDRFVSNKSGREIVEIMAFLMYLTLCDSIGVNRGTSEDFDKWITNDLLTNALKDISGISTNLYSRVIEDVTPKDIIGDIIDYARLNTKYSQIDLTNESKIIGNDQLLLSEELKKEWIKYLLG